MIKGGWVPRTLHQDDPRNMLTLCPNHGKAFQRYRWCVDTTPDIPTFHNISRDTGLESLHGSTLRMDFRREDTPLKNLLICHAQSAYMDVRQFRSESYGTRSMDDLFRGPHNGSEGIDQ